MDVEELKQEIEKVKANFEEAQQRIAALQVVHEVASSLTLELNLEPLLHKILAKAVEVMTASAGSLLLLDELTEELVFAVIEGGGGENLKGVRMSRDKGIAGWVAATHEPVIANNAPQDWRFSPVVDEVFNFSTRSLVCVPMVTRRKLVGVIEVLNRQAGENYTEADVNLLLILGNVSATALETMRVRLDAEEASVATH